VGTSVAAPYVIAGASIYFTLRFGYSMYEAYFREVTQVANHWQTLLKV